MAMMNMMKKASREEMYEEKEYDEPKYPYGLCISLCQDSMEKLGITALPEVGSEMMIHAKVYVKSTRAYETMEDGEDMGMDLQITDMEIMPAEGEANNEQRASMLYGGGE